MLLDASNITVAYGGLLAVNDVSVGVDSEEIVGLIGPNGAGKTSLFEAISGFLNPVSGRIVIDGRDVTNSEPHRRCEAGLTRTFQRLELFAHLTVHENLLAAAEARLVEYGLAADVLGLRQADQKSVALANETATRLGLRGVSARLAGELPAGLGRLVEVGRALCTSPKVVLLDEPTAGLDEEETDELGSTLREIVAGGGPSVFIVEHDVEFITGLASRIYVMDSGSLIAHDTPRRIQRHPDVRRAYLGAK